MDIFLSIVAIICGLVGIIGSVIPILPGPALAFVGMLCVHWTGDSVITTKALWIWGIVTLIVTILDYILPGYFSKALGGSRAGIIGATIGIFAGLFMGPFGIILGPFAGAVIGELIHNNQNLDKAIKVGFGSLISFIAGSGIKIVISGIMFCLIWKDIWATIWA